MPFAQLHDFKLDRRLNRLIRGICLTTVLASSLVTAAPHTASAEVDAGVVGDGTSASCTEAALNTALLNGGAVTFSCGGPKTVALTTPKTIAQSTTIEGGNQITLTGNFATRLFIVNADTQFVLRNITLEKGISNGTDGGAIVNHGTLHVDHSQISTSFTDIGHSGGAIFTDGPAYITNSIFLDNAAGSAGAIFANFSNAQISITGSTFKNNTAQNPTTGYGGAVWVGTQAQLILADSSFSSNIAQYGGALYLTEGSTATLRTNYTPDTLSFVSNRATEDGGAIYNNATLSIYTANFIGNTIPMSAPFHYGGAIFNQGTLNLTSGYMAGNEGRFGGTLFVGGNNNARASIDKTIFNKNKAGQSGGGIYANVQTTTLTVTHSIFYQNTAVLGGGIARVNAQFTVSNTSFVQNEASFGGGVSMSWLPPGTFPGRPYTRIENVTFSGNKAVNNKGGAVYNEGSGLELYYATLKDNTNGLYTVGANSRLRSTILDNPNSLNCDGDGSVPSNDSANFATDTSCGLLPTNVITDAKLGPLQGDGFGTTSYHLPLTGSVLINAGYANCPTLDQRGAQRPDACDVGAVEFGGLVPQGYLPFVQK